MFTPRPFVLFKSPRTLRDRLVRSKVYPLEREVGCSGCGHKSCKVCANMVDSRTFSSHITGTQYSINHKFNCNSKCVVYLLSCVTCGLQYVGQTSDKFRLRWNNYVSCQKKAAAGGTPPQAAFHNHFLQENHRGLVNDVKITIIDKTDASDPLTRERFWIDKIETMTPQGLNTEDNT